jgi:transcriptional regulator with XRE-family HTH domain
VSACATPVTYVVDAESELKPLLRSLHAPSAGRVHCYAASSRAVARVLEAMGNCGSHPQKPDFAIAWLLGRGIRDIFLDHADRMDSNQRRQVIELAYLLEMRLWLIDPEPGHGSALPNQLRRWAIPQITAAEFRERWGAQLTPGTPATEQTVVLPDHLPDSDFFFFADDCRRLLDVGQRDAVLGLYWSAYDLAAAWVSSTPVDGDAALRYAWDVMRGSYSIPEAVIRLKATQAALFANGKALWMHVEHIRFEHTMQSVNSLEDSVQRLYATPSPQEAALGFVVLAFRPPDAELAAMRLDDVNPDASALTIAGKTHEIPACGRPILRAQLLWRGLLPHTGDHLFSSSPYDTYHATMRPATTEDIRTQRFKVSRRTDLDLATAGVPSSPQVAGPEAGGRALPISPRMTESSLIDWPFVKHRRLELGLTREALASAIGYAAPHLRLLEEGRYDGSRTTSLERLGGIADALSIRIGDLLVAARPELNADRLDDAQRLGALLMQPRHPTTASGLAEGLGFTIGQLHAAADVLDSKLDGCGLRLLRTPWDLGADPRVLGAQELKRSLAVARTTQGIKKPTAAVLYRVITGHINSGAIQGTRDRTRLHHLINHGVLQSDARGGFLLHSSVAYSLGLQRFAGDADGPRLYARRAEAQLADDPPITLPTRSRACRERSHPD